MRQADDGIKAPRAPEVHSTSVQSWCGGRARIPEAGDDDDDDAGHGILKETGAEPKQAAERSRPRQGPVQPLWRRHYEEALQALLEHELAARQTGRAGLQLPMPEGYRELPEQTWLHASAEKTRVTYNRGGRQWTTFSKIRGVSPRPTDQ